MEIPVSEFIVRYMERLGIEFVFGMPGAHILPVYDALYDSTIRTVLAKHEQGAAFMAGGCQRASGTISACIATAGPGATNLLTGIANAYADKQPLLIITGEAPTYIFGKGGLQESSGEGDAIDQQALLEPVTRYTRVIERTDYLPNVLNRAANILLSPTAGPVALILPFNVQKERLDERLLDSIKTSPQHLAYEPDKPAIGHFRDLLLAAERPVIVAGYGCIQSDSQQLVSRLSETMNIPVATSLKGKGVIQEGSVLSLGSLGVTSYGGAYRYIAEQSDLVVFLGAGFNERTSHVWDNSLLDDKQIVQVDSNPEQLDKVFKADVAIQGNIRDVLSDILEQLAESPAGHRPGSAPPPSPAAVNDRETLAHKFPLMAYFYRTLAEQRPEQTRIFDDNIIFAQNFYPVSPANRFHPNSGISSLGHAIPAAIGARFSDQHSTWAILGDGGFQMCCMEIMTAVNYDIPLNIVVISNGTMGLIRKNQDQQYRQRFIDCDFTNPDLELFARSLGVHYYRADSSAAIDGLFRELDLEQAINLIEIPIDRHIYPNYSSKR